MASVNVSLGDRLSSAMKRRGLKNPDVASAVGVHAGTVSQWRSDRFAPDDDRLEQLARLLGVSVAWLRYGEPVGAVREDPATYVASPRKRLPAAVYSRISEYLERMQKADCSEEQVAEAERLMSESNYAQLHSGRPDELSVEDQLLDVDALWEFIRAVLSRDGRNV